MTVETSRLSAGTGTHEQVISNIQTLMKDSTEEKHTEISTHCFIKSVFNVKQGVSDRAYCQYLVDLNHIHATLEKELENNKANPTITPLCIAGIYRSERIASDLKSFTVGDIQPSHAANTYADHIKEISSKTPYLLIAHAYVRYLADLSGGQMMQGRIKKIWPGREMLNFYSFDEWLEEVPEASKMSELRDYYRRILNRISLSQSQIDEIIKEAHKAYKYTYDMLNEMLNIPHWNEKTVVSQEDLHEKLCQAIISGDYQLLHFVCHFLQETVDDLTFSIGAHAYSLKASTNDGEDLFTVSMLNQFSQETKQFEKGVALLYKEETLKTKTPPEIQELIEKITPIAKLIKQ